MKFREVAALAASALFLACAPPVLEESEHEGSTASHEDAPADVAVTGFDVLVIAGQSNAVGQGTGDYGDDPSLAAEDSKIFQIGRRGDADQKVIAAKDPLDFWVIPADWWGKGFSMPLARRYAKSVLAPGRRLLLVPAAQGATVISSWDPAQPGSLYADMKSRTALALAQPGDNRLIGVVWQQGESDVMALAGPNPGYDASGYGAHVQAIASSLRADFANQGCFPFLAGEMSREWTEWPGLASDAIIAQKAAVNASLLKSMPFIPCSSLVGSDGLHGNPGDLVHFTAASQAILGARYAAILGANGNDRAGRSAFLTSVYTGIFNNPPPATVLSTWTDSYRPAAGVGCRAITQAFALAAPLRSAGEIDDAALSNYVHALYRALLPAALLDNTDEIVGWHSQGLLTMDQLDGIFLDDQGFRDRCSAAGIAF